MGNEVTKMNEQYVTTWMQTSELDENQRKTWTKNENTNENGEAHEKKMKKNEKVGHVTKW